MATRPLLPFRIGSLVTWKRSAPKTWRYIHTPGPMKVVDAYYHDGVPSPYALLFGPNGMCITPGWIITVEYDPDLTGYYDPPLSVIHGKKLITTDVHQKWLVKAK